MNKPRWALLCIFITAVFLRLLNLSSHDFWYDEAVILWSTGTLQAGHWFYSLFISAWISLFSPAIFQDRFIELIGRLPSAIFSLGAVLATYTLGKKMFGKTVALLAAALMSISPFHIWYAQEMRAYAMALCLSLWGTYFFWRWSNEKNNAPKFLTLYVIFASLAYVSHYLTIFLLVPQFIYLYVRKNKFSQIKWILIPLLGILIISPVVIKHVLMLTAGNWPAMPDTESLRMTLATCLLGYNGTSLLYGIFFWMCTLLAVYLTWLIISRHDDNQTLLFCIAAFFIPVLSIYLFSRFFPSIYIDRYFLFFSPHLYFLLSLTLLRISFPLLRFFLIIIIFSILTLSNIRYFSDNLYIFPNGNFHVGLHLKKPFRPLVQHLINYSHSVKEFKIIYGNVSTSASFALYTWIIAPDEFKRSFIPDFVKIAYDPDLSDEFFRKKYANVPMYKTNPLFISKQQLAADISAGPRIPIIFIACDWDRTGQLDENSQSIKSILDSFLTLSSVSDFSGIKVHIYN